MLLLVPFTSLLLSTARKITLHIRIRSSKWRVSVSGINQVTCCVRQLLYYSPPNREAVPLTWMFWKKRRYIVVFMAFLGFFNVYSLRVNLSVGIVAMTENRTVEYANGTIGYVSAYTLSSLPCGTQWKSFECICTQQEQDFPWNSKERGLILSSFFWGYITTQFLGGLFGARIGGNLVSQRITKFNSKQGPIYN